ncbi:MAG: hypothetical protein AAF512_16265 [Pseudomonadota bacterium]
MFHRLTLMTVLCLWMTNASGKGLENCREKLVPINMPVPTYPSYQQSRAHGFMQGSNYMHVIVEGFVLVEFWIIKTGSVANITILDSKSLPVGIRGSTPEPKHLKGFLEINVLPSISQWLFEPIEEPCLVTRKFTYEFEPDSEEKN